jgi:hypothetical protein
MFEKEKEDLDNYFQENLGISVDSIVGFTDTLKKDVICATASNSNHDKIMPLVINKGTIVKITGNYVNGNVGFNPSYIKPLGQLNRLYFEIVNPQIRINMFETRMEELVEALSKTHS